MTNKEYKKTIIDILNLGDLPEELQEELIDDVADSVMQSVVVYAMEKMNTADCKTLVNYLDNDEDIEKFFGFMEEKVPDINQVLISEIKKYATN